MFQKHVKSSLAFAQACQTTYSEMPCAYYIISRSTRSDGMSPKLQCLPGFKTLTPFSSVEDHPHEGATDILFPLSFLWSQTPYQSFYWGLWILLCFCFLNQRPTLRVRATLSCFSLKKSVYIYIYVCYECFVYIHMCNTSVPGACRGQKRAVIEPSGTGVSL